MSKLGLFGVSLVAALPAGILSALLVMTFLGNADKLTGMLWAISVPTLLTSVLVALLPVGVLLFGPKSDAADADDDVAVDDEDGFAADAGSVDDVDAFGDEEEDLMAGEGDELTMDGEDEFDDADDTLDGEGDDLFMEDDDDDFGLEMDEDDEDK